MDRAHGGAGGVSAQIGVGLRGPHRREIQTSRPAIGWFEVHPENYMENGPALADLLEIRRDYPLSLHGVGLSLGSAEGIDRDHLRRFNDIAQATEPFLISEHLSWSVSEGVYLNDLLPLPYTEECLEIVAANISAVQEALGRPILVENPSAYLRFRHATIPEPEFLAELARRTGCGLLCDVNNIYVTCTNFGEDANSYLDALPADAVAEIHLAGHCRTQRLGRDVLIDDHGAAVCPEVWALYRRAVARFGLVPSLIEWDRNIPPLATLLGEARLARSKAESTLFALEDDHVPAA